MTPQDAPIPTPEAQQFVPPAVSKLPSFPRKTEAGYYGPRKSGPNAKAVSAFVLSLAGGSVIALVLAVIALGDIRDTGQAGRSLAIVAIVISILWLPFECYVFLRN